MKTRSAWAVLVLLLSAFGLGDGRAGAVEFTVAELPQGGDDLALDLQTGNLAAIHSRTKTIHLYASALKGTGPLTPMATGSFDKEPREIVFKQTPGGSFFVVRVQEDPHLYVFDSTTLKRKAEIELPANVTAIGASVSPADSYVYCSYGRVPDHIGASVDTGRTGIARIDPTGGTHERIYFGPAIGCVVSAQGDLLYFRVHFTSEAHRIVPATEPGKPPTLKRIARLDKSYVRPVPDGLGFCTGNGTDIRSAGLEARMARCGFEPACFLAKRPIVVGIQASQDLLAGRQDDDSEQAELLVASSNTYQVVDRVKLPAEMFPKSGTRHFVDQFRPEREHQFDFLRHGYRILADEPRNRILVTNSNRVAVVPTAGLPPKDETPLVLYGDTAAPLSVGKSQVVRVAALDPGITLELVDPPGDAKLSAKGLEWTPGQTDVGPNVFQFRLKFGAIQRTVPILVNVERERTALPPDLRRYAFSGDGKSLFLWKGTPGKWAHEEKGPPRGALVDLTGAKPTVAAEFPLEYRQAEVDEHFVYAVPAKSSEIVILDRGTLAEKQRLRLADHVLWIKAVQNKTLAVGLGDGRWYAYSVPELTLKSEHKMGDVQFIEHSSLDQPVPMSAIDEGWKLASGDVFDATLTKQTLFASEPDLQTVFPAGRRSPPQRIRIDKLEGNGVPKSLHLGAALPDEPYGMGAQLIAEQSGEEIPSAARLDQVWKSWHVVLYRAEGRLGHAYRSLPIAKYLLTPPPFNYREPPGGIALAGDRLYVLLEDHLYWIPVADLKNSSDPPLPLALSPRPSTMVLDPAGTTKLTHAPIGGQPPYQFNLTTPRPGLKLDPATGEVTVDGPALTAAAIDMLGGSIVGNQPNRGTWSSSEAVLGYWGEKAGTFEKMAGRKPKGVPLSVPIEVEVADAKKATARLRYFTLLELPRKDLDERIARVAAESDRVRQEQQAAIAASRQAEMERRSPAAAGSETASPQTLARIRQLEERFGALEAQLDAIIQLLEAKAKKDAASGR
jgi:hypothetical protein